jgi:hypothetical protein
MNPTLTISQGPEEISFTGQSPTSETATPIGTGFIQGTGAMATSSLSPLLVIGIVILTAIVLRGMR